MLFMFHAITKFVNCAIATILPNVVTSTHAFKWGTKDRHLVVHHELFNVKFPNIEII